MHALLSEVLLTWGHKAEGRIMRTLLSEVLLTRGTQGRRPDHAYTVAPVTIFHIKIMIRNVLISVSLTPAAVAHLSHRPIAKCFYQL